MKKLITSIALLSAFTATLQADPKTGCVLAQKGDVTAAWMAYKTPLKVGVSGIFDNVKYKSVAKEGKNFREILVGSSVAIDTKSVNSKNAPRDAKLVKFFFNSMNSQKISAKIVDIKADERVKNKPRTGIVTLDITMNGVKKRVPMKYNFKDSVFSAKGVIDILDFSAQPALSAINKACYSLHQGKTWSDVTIAFTTHIEALLCNTKSIK